MCDCWQFLIFFYSVFFFFVICRHGFSCRLIAGALGVTVIDYFSLDVEGNELNVLKGFDWDNVLIRVMLVEMNGQDEERDEEIRKVLTAHQMINVPFQSIAQPALNEIWAHTSVQG